MAENQKIQDEIQERLLIEKQNESQKKSKKKKKSEYQPEERLMSEESSSQEDEDHFELLPLNVEDDYDPLIIRYEQPEIVTMPIKKRKLKKLNMMQEEDEQPEVLMEYDE